MAGKGPSMRLNASGKVGSGPALKLGSSKGPGLGLAPLNLKVRSRDAGASSRGGNIGSSLRDSSKFTTPDLERRDAVTKSTRINFGGPALTPHGPSLGGTPKSASVAAEPAPAEDDGSHDGSVGRGGSAGSGVASTRPRLQPLHGDGGGGSGSASVRASARAVPSALPSPALSAPPGTGPPVVASVRRGGPTGRRPQLFKTIVQAPKGAGDSADMMTLGQEGSLTLIQREMLKKWRTSIQADLKSMDFASPVLEAEFLLRRAQVFGSKVDGPNPLGQAVALEALTSLSLSQGNLFGGLLVNVRDILAGGIFVPQDAEKVKMWTHDDDTVDSLGRYLTISPYSERVGELEDELEEKDREISKLKKHVEALLEATDSKVAVEVRKRVEAEEKVERAEAHFKLMTSQVRAAQEELEEFKALGAIDVIRKLYATMSPVEQSTTLHEMLETTPDAIPNLVSDLMMGLQPNIVLRICFNSLVHKDAISQDELRGFMLRLLDSPKSKGGMPGNRLRTIIDIVQQSGEEHLHVLVAVLKMMPPEETKLLLRQLAGFVKRDTIQWQLSDDKEVDPDREKPAEVEDVHICAGFETQDELETLGTAVFRRMRPSTVETFFETAMQEKTDAYVAAFTGANFQTLSRKRKQEVLRDLMVHLTDDEKKAFAKAELRHLMAPDPPSIVIDAPLSLVAVKEKEPEPEPPTPEPEKPPAFQSPFAKYMLKPGKGVKKVKMKVEMVGLMIYDIYEKKIASDEIDDREGEPRDSLPQFVRDFLIQKYGLPSICEGYLFSVTNIILDNAESNPRLRLFGVLCGVVEPNLYDYRLCNIVLRLYKLMFQKFGAVVLRSRRPGKCIAMMTAVVAAVESTFTDKRIAFKTSNMQLTHGRKTKLLDQVNALAIKYSEKVPEHEQEKEWSKDAVVADVDEVLRLVIDICHDQLRDDKERLMEMYTEYDDDGNGVLTFDEFTVVIQALVGSPVPLKKTTKLFNEVSAVDDATDFVSREAFAFMCMTHGLTPPVKDLKQANRGLAAAAAFSGGSKFSMFTKLSTRNLNSPPPEEGKEGDGGAAGGAGAAVGGAGAAGGLGAALGGSKGGGMAALLKAKAGAAEGT